MPLNSELQELQFQLLELLGRSGEKIDLIREIALLIKKATRFEAIGIRLREGEDYPYYTTAGFPEEFVELERNLCGYDSDGELIRDREDNPVLACMCGNVIQGRTDPSLPFFTENGSFWTNSTTELLASTSEEDRQARTRNRCNGEGYKSVALIPLRSGKTNIGLLQMNDSRIGVFTPEMISLFERIGASVGVALVRKEMEDALRVSEETLQTIFDSTPGLVFFKDKENRIVRANRALCDALGLPEKELIGRPLSELFLDYGEEYWKDDLEVIESGEPKIGIDEPMETPGGTRWFRTDKVPYRNPGGEILGIIGILVDITERKQAEEKLLEAKERWEKSFRAVGESMFIIDKDHNILQHNRAFAELLGRKPEDITGQKCYELVHGLKEPPDFCATRAAVREKRSVKAELYEPYLGKHLAVSADPAFDSEGNVDFFLHLIRDVTEQREAQERVREAERRYREFAESLPQVVFELDMKRNVTYVNQNALEEFGYSREELESGIPALDVIAEIDRENVGAAIDKMYSGQMTGEVREYVAKRKDGTEFPCIIYSTLITDTVGNPAGIRGILTDISERKRAEMELQRINTELEGFSQTVSHDLRGPLSAISLAAGLLQKLTREPQTEEILEDIGEVSEAISRNIDKSTTLIEDLLSHAAAGAKPPQVEDVDVGTIVQTVIEESAGAIADRGIEVKTAADLGHVTANRTQMYQVFSNLIGNAIKHNDSKSPRIEISYLGADEKDRHRYLVKDNGSGIPPDDLEKIFIPFFKGKSGETGIGLSTVKKIVKLHGGSIRAYIDNGACFELVIGNLEGSA